ncbi:uncharacterized protein LOC119368659 [Triticum dicoccoides]|uniref:uncharacterized protein LOC119368659 n=1 Tax=Triticum dicoccoides TaxID=85692 RepID=UPI000E78A367|nr:uncharacterized protein LOC119368659 [Triticum dicoccoides]
MASFAAQLLDVFYDLVERVTGYSARAKDDKDLQKHSKLATTEAFRTGEVVEIRSRKSPGCIRGVRGPGQLTWMVCRASLYVRQRHPCGF